MALDLLLPHHEDFYEQLQTIPIQWLLQKAIASGDTNIIVDSNGIPLLVNDDIATEYQQGGELEYLEENASWFCNN